MELTVNGRSAYAATGGASFDPSQPGLVFLHGAGMDRTVWALQARYFAHHGHAVLAVDLPGHGRSDGPALTSIEDAASWVSGLLDAAGLQRAALVGHSMGGLIALEAAAQFGDRIIAIAVLGAGDAMPVNEALLTATKDDPAAAIRFIVSWAYGQRAHIGGMRAPGLWMLAGGQRLLERDGGATLYADFNACNAYQRGPAAASAVSCPAIVIGGASDRMVPMRACQQLSESLPNGRLAMIPDSGHMMMIEKPDATLKALATFL